MKPGQRDRIRWFTMIGVVLMLMGVAPARSGVSGSVNDLQVARGQRFQVGLTLDSDVPVFGINGELTYDPTFLSNPQVFNVGGAPETTVAGHEVSLGTYRFVAYKDPIDTALASSADVIGFRFDVSTTGGAPVATQIDFPIAAAATIDLTDPTTVISVAIGGPGGDPSPASVSIESFTVTVVNAVYEWVHYE